MIKTPGNGQKMSSRADTELASPCLTLKAKKETQEEPARCILIVVKEFKTEYTRVMESGETVEE